MLGYSSDFLHCSKILTCDCMTDVARRWRQSQDADANRGGNKDKTGGYGECGNISSTFCIKKYSPSMIGCAAGG